MDSPVDDFANPLTGKSTSNFSVTTISVDNETQLGTELNDANNPEIALIVKNQECSSNCEGLIEIVDNCAISKLQNDREDKLLSSSFNGDWKRNTTRDLEEGICPVETAEVLPPIPTDLLPQSKFGNFPRNILRNYLLLWKSRLSLLIVFTALGSYYCTQEETGHKKSPIIALCVGTFMQSACANSLNEMMEVDRDRIMNRTKGRPLPSGTISMRHSAIQAAVVGFAGTYVLGSYCNWNTALLGLANIGIYAGLYTPMKTKHWLNTWIGTIPGSIPTLMGSCAATSGQILHPVGLFWFSLMTLWQIPHFMAISYKCRNEYQKANYRMLPIEEPTKASFMAVLHSLALFPLCWSLPYFVPQVPWWFAVVSTSFNWSYLLKPSLEFHSYMKRIPFNNESQKIIEKRHYDNATKLFWGSLKHLPLLFSMSIIAFNWNSIANQGTTLFGRVSDILNLNKLNEWLSLEKLGAKLQLHRMFSNFSLGIFSK